MTRRCSKPTCARTTRCPTTRSSSRTSPFKWRSERPPTERTPGQFHSSCALLQGQVAARAVTPTCPKQRPRNQLP